MRSVALVLTACLAMSTAASCSTEAAITPTTTTTTPDAPPASAADLRFEPVLIAFGVPCGELAAASEVEVDPAALSPADGDCYDLTGDAGLDGTGLVSDAAAELSPQGEWLLALELTPAGIDAFNALAASCFNRSAECPTGQLAIVVDGVVVSAPSIQAPSFERDQIQISGEFDESEAKELALALGLAQP